MKKNWKSACVAIAMIAVVGLLWACNEGDGPTSPSSMGFTPAPAPQFTTTNNPNPAPTPPSSEPTLLEIFPGRIWSPGGKTIKAEITNKSGRGEWVGFACYEAPRGVDNLHAQKLFDGWVTLQLANGDNYKFEIPLPECVWQCDLFIGRKKPKTPPVYNANELVRHVDSEQLGFDLPKVCEPPCVEDCGDDECVQTPDPSRKGWECEWLGDAVCKWGCKCVPTDKPPCPEMIWDYASCSWVGGCECEPVGEPDCPEQKWDPIKCKWVGDCACEPVGEPDCPIQRWDPVKCKWVGDCGCTLTCEPGEHLHPDTCDCWCDPVGEPECDTQTWNERKCKWEGPCVCEPTGEPECDEQTWDTRKCKWVGDCPCELECGFGYELNEDRCKCEPEDLCHVSNKGNPSGDWSIQEQQKKFTPGHEGHLDKSKFCPPDYFGICYGKWDNAPNMCDSSN